MTRTTVLTAELGPHHTAYSFAIAQALGVKVQIKHDRLIAVEDHAIIRSGEEFRPQRNLDLLLDIAQHEFICTRLEHEGWLAWTAADETLKGFGDWPDQAMLNLLLARAPAQLELSEAMSVIHAKEEDNPYWYDTGMSADQIVNSQPRSKLH